MAQRVQLCRLLPKPAVQAQQEVFIPRPLSDIAALPSSEASEPQAIKTSRRSLGQKRRQERESQENAKPVESESSRTHRSVAQQARQQRALAASIEQQDMSSKRLWCDPDLRSKAQKFRRRIEAAERRLEVAPDCDPTQALERILGYNYDNWSRHRRESHRDRMQRMYGNYNYR